MIEDFLPGVAVICSGKLHMKNGLRIFLSIFWLQAKAVKHLWIAGISSSVTKEQLEDEFLKFGKIQGHRFLRDRNSALIDYHKTEDAIAAQKNMNGKHLGGEQLRVDFQRSQPPRKDWPDQRDSTNVQFSSQDLGLQEWLLPPDGRGYHDSSYHGTKRNLLHGGRRDDHPSHVLWIGYPPSVQIDEQKLHNAMILFGEIERIRCFPLRNYSFVEFRSIDEARRAKEGLQGRLFNDPRIQILFSSSELAPVKYNTLPFPGFRGPRPEMLFAEGPVGPLESYGPGHAIAPSSFPGSLLPNSMPGHGILMRPFGPQGFHPFHGSLEFHDSGGITAHSNWRWRPPSCPEISSSSPSMCPPFRPMPGLRNESDMRKFKRIRIDGSSTDSSFFHARRVDDEGLGDPFGFSQPDRCASSQNCPSPVVHGYDEPHPSSDSHHWWRGILAKGGTPVCRARCMPIGKGIDSPFPEVVNCSARTGLDMLAKHCATAIGFDIVFFLPDRKEDFDSYTEFCHYLGLKSRAGVAKLDDGTTLFLVPPSDFLTKVLNVSSDDCLYGVVLKLPQQSTNAMVQPQLAIPPLPSHHIDQQEASKSQKGYQSVPQNEDQALKVDYNRPLYEEPMHRPGVGKSLLMLADEACTAQSASLDDAGKSAAASQVGVSLTPELISALASLIPSNNQSSAARTVQMPSVSTSGPVSSSASVIHDAFIPFEGWRHDLEAVSRAPLGQTSHLPQHLGQQFNSQAPCISHFPTYANISSGLDHSAEPIVGSTQVQNPALTMPEAPSVPARSSYNNSIPSHGAQFLGSFASHNYYGMLQTTNAAGVFDQAVQQLKPSSSSTHDQIENLPQPEIAIPATQGNQPQTVLSGTSMTDSDADKNQRYQSTLQLAASLLLQLQQQQQASAQAVQGAGNQH